jgi:small subunit ribosomal protein S20
MPQTKAAKKSLKQTAVRTKKNLEIKSEIKSLTKKFKTFVQQGNESESKKLLITLQKKLDKAAKIKLMKKNTVNRKKSSLTKLFNSKF